MKELEDYKWFPALFRNFQTDFIGFVVRKGNVYSPFVDYLNAQCLQALPMYDVCSGSGEPAISIYTQSNCFSQLTLSDKFPRHLRFKDATIQYDAQSVDVLHMPFQQHNCYTMFNALHHFSDTEKTALVNVLQNSGASAFLVELLEPTFLCILKVIFATTIGCMVLTPFIRPFSFKRLLFTYVLPINLFTIAIDGIISVLKSRSVQQYQRLLANGSTNIKICRLHNGLSPLTIIHIPPQP